MLLTRLKVLDSMILTLGLTFQNLSFLNYNIQNDINIYIIKINESKELFPYCHNIVGNTYEI